MDCAEASRDAVENVHGVVRSCPRSTSRRISQALPPERTHRPGRGKDLDFELRGVETLGWEAGGFKAEAKRWLIL